MEQEIVAVSVAFQDEDEPPSRRYCEVHDCTYGWGCPHCRDEAADRQFDDRLNARQGKD